MTCTALDESHVRKAFNRVLETAELRVRGPHQMRHTFASLLLQDRAPITYVSRQVGHKDASITLRCMRIGYPTRRPCETLIGSTTRDQLQPLRNRRR